LIKILLFSFDAITLAFFIEGETKQPIQRTLSGLNDFKSNRQTLNKPDSTRQQRRPNFYQDIALNLISKII